MFSRFFIDRPIFATVLSIVVTLAGSVAVFTLPIAQYPQITPPSIIVSCNYAGADARVVAETVAAPIEQQVNGVESMLYMVSQSTNDGAYTLTVTFKPGVNLNFAQVLVQNRVNLALPQMPDVVKQTGITTRKRSPDILLIVSVMSEDTGEYTVPRDNLYLSNYALIQVRDELVRLDGVGDVFIFGQQDYSMRLWVDPDRLAALNLSAGDVANAIREQNNQVAAGQIGQRPAGDDQQFQTPLSTLGRLNDTEQFEQIVLRAYPDGRVVRFKDIGHVALGAKNQDINACLNGAACTNLAVFQLPDANALDTADRIRDKMSELKRSFPAGVGYKIAYDTTPFIKESIDEVFKTLRDAVILVALVVLVFLQNWRSTIIPLVAVPVAIVGTFAVMAAIGFSLNNLTLFGLVLAIGIVVDDAIVVVEAVEHHIEEGMLPRAATIRAMEEVSGPVVAVALVLSAVFIPCAFIAGITGQFFRQFALTIAVSTIISAFNSLTLSPALSAILLQPKGAKRDPLTFLLDVTLGWFFNLFNFSFRIATSVYSWIVSLGLRLCVIVLVLYCCLLGATYWGFTNLPVGYIPLQDKGYMLASVQLPDATSLERTREVVNQVDRIVREEEGVSDTISIAGQSFVLSANGSNFGQLFIVLNDFHSRRDPRLYSDEIIKRLKARIGREVPDATVAIFGPPAVSGLGTAGGFKIIIEDRGDLGLTALQEQVDNLIVKSRDEPHKAQIKDLFTVFRANAPQLYVDTNREQCFKLGVQLQDVDDTVNIYLGSLYVNDFNKFGRTWQVVVQADGEFRSNVESVKRLKVRNATGGMVPLGTLATVKEITGPLIIGRYNMYTAAPISGNASPGVSSGRAIDAMQQLAQAELPRAMAYEWTEISFIQLQAGNTGLILFILAVMLVFLVLAAQYESWALPMAVILVVPMCLLGSIIGVWVAKTDTYISDINIFTQVGFVVLVGLASKNAILIVEFAKVKREHGLSRRDATMEASKLRLRPILMTSFAFILGVLPLLLARGAGAEMRWALGIAVFSGMLGVTISGIFLTPVFFFVVDWLGGPTVHHSAFLHRFNQRLRDILTLGAVRRSQWFAGITGKRAPSVQKPPAGPPPTGEGIQLK